MILDDNQQRISSHSEPHITKENFTNMEEDAEQLYGVVNPAYEGRLDSTTKNKSEKITNFSLS